MTRKGRLSVRILSLVLIGVSTQAASRITFTPAVELCAGCGGQGIAVDGSGRIYAAWTTSAGAFNLWTSVDGGTTFTPVGGPYPGVSSAGGAIAIDVTGNVVHLVWWAKDLVGPQACDGDFGTPGIQPSTCLDVLYARSFDGGGTFSDPVNISNAYFGVLLPRIAIDTFGQVVNVVWSQATTGEGNICCAREVYFSRSLDGGSTFSLPQRLSALQDSNNVDIATDASGNVINVVWWVSSAGGAVRQVYFVRSTDGVTFSAAKLLGNGQYPSVANDASGYFVNVAYAQSGIRFIRSDDGGATFSSPAAISKVGYQPSMAADPTGNLIDLVWSEGGGAKQWVRFARSSNGGKTFSTPRTIANVNQRYVVRPDLAVDGNGNINAIWAEFSSDTYTSDVYYSRGTP